MADDETPETSSSDSPKTIESAATTAKKPLWKWWWAIALAIFLAIRIASALVSPPENTGASNPGSDLSTQAPTETPTTGATPTENEAPTEAPTTEAPPPPPAKRYRTFSDGTWEVGKDIKAGTYRTREGASGCYWARLKNFNGDLDSINANDNTEGPAVVTILTSDKGFESNDCGGWTSDLSRITDSQTSFPGEGTYIVGVDVKPGTYRNTGGDDSCYWARLKNFRGDLSSIHANDNSSGSTIVTIKSTDKGFESNGCGTWTRR